MNRKDCNSNGPIAHVTKDRAGSWLFHNLDEHLTATARLSSQFASKFGNEDWARLLGLWHDLGKYRPAFQEYIRNASGCEPSAHLESTKQTKRVDHSTAGAIHAINSFNTLGRILAYCIAGHHTGLQDWEDLAIRLDKTPLLEECVALVPKEILQATIPQSRPNQACKNPIYFSLWIRMLFSCLCDADFLDTESFMDAERSEQRGCFESLPNLLALLEKHTNQLEQNSKPNVINAIRKQVLSDCKVAASKSGPLFTLTVPTGGGKTISSLMFALNHAIEHKKDRVIYVIPYTSIIEQTSNIFKSIFGVNNVIEHHSNFEPQSETPKSRLACENWDAPIIVTTNVQFFESLFAHKTSKVRKLHSIANSVVIFDEVQLLPPKFLNPILATLTSLMENFKSTVVLCTATQPALTSNSPNDEHKRGELFQLKPPCEIIQNAEELHSRMKRFRLELPKSWNSRMDWQYLAAELSQYPTVLCIVDRRDDCKALAQLLPDDTIHLSGYMCGQHRAECIESIKTRLKQGIPTRVISTQLVEAGVDIDFPVVYRSIAGLDSIAQAGGRCNREGLNDEGLLRVFVPPKDPPKDLKMSAEIAKRLLQSEKTDKLSLEQFKSYFNDLYWCHGNRLDTYNIIEDLKNRSGGEVRFRSASHNFKLVDDNSQTAIAVLWGQSAQVIDQIKETGINRNISRQLQRYIVNLPKNQARIGLNDGVLEEIEGLIFQRIPTSYSAKYGLMIGNALIEPEALFV